MAGIDTHDVHVYKTQGSAGYLPMYHFQAHVMHE
jgi:hypothetical protein